MIPNKKNPPESLLKKNTLFLFLCLVVFILFSIILVYNPNAIGDAVRIINKPGTEIEKPIEVDLKPIITEDLKYTIVSPKSGLYESSDYLNLIVNFNETNLNNIHCSWTLLKDNGQSIEISNFCNDQISFNELKMKSNHGDNYKLYLQINQIIEDSTIENTDSKKTILNKAISKEYISSPIYLTIIPANSFMGAFVFDEPSSVIDSSFTLDYYLPLSEDMSDNFNNTLGVNLVQYVPNDGKGSESSVLFTEIDSFFSSIVTNDCYLKNNTPDGVAPVFTINNSLTNSENKYAKYNFSLVCKHPGTKYFFAQVYEKDYQKSLLRKTQNSANSDDFSTAKPNLFNSLNLTSYNIYKLKNYNLDFSLSKIPVIVQDDEEIYYSDKSEDVFYFANSEEPYIPEDYTALEINVNEYFWLSSFFEYIPLETDTLEDFSQEYNNLQNSVCNITIYQDKENPVYNSNFPCNSRKKIRLDDSVSSGEYKISVETNFNNKNYLAEKKIKVNVPKIRIMEMSPNYFRAYPSQIQFVTKLRNVNSNPVSVTLRIYTKRKNNDVVVPISNVDGDQTEILFSSFDNTDTLYFSSPSPCDDLVNSFKDSKDEFIQELIDQYFLEEDLKVKEDICSQLKDFSKNLGSCDDLVNSFKDSKDEFIQKLIDQYFLEEDPKVKEDICSQLKDFSENLGPCDDLVNSFKDSKDEFIQKLIDHYFSEEDLKVKEDICSQLKDFSENLGPCDDLVNSFKDSKDEFIQKLIDHYFSEEDLKIKEDICSQLEKNSLESIDEFIELKETTITELDVSTVTDKDFVSSPEYYLLGEYDFICNSTYTNCSSPNIKFRQIGSYFGLVKVVDLVTGDELNKETRFNINLRPLSLDIDTVGYKPNPKGDFVESTESIYTAKAFFKYKRGNSEYYALAPYCEWDFSKSVDVFSHDNFGWGRCAIQFTAEDFDQINLSANAKDNVFSLRPQNFTSETEINPEPELRIRFTNTSIFNNSYLFDDYFDPYYGYHQYKTDVNFSGAISYIYDDENIGGFYYKDVLLDECTWYFRKQPVYFSNSNELDNPKGNYLPADVEEEPWSQLSGNSCENVNLDFTPPIGIYELKLEGVKDGFSMSKTVLFRVRECDYDAVECPFGGICNRDGSCTYAKYDVDSLESAKDLFDYKVINSFDTYLKSPYFSPNSRVCSIFRSQNDLNTKYLDQYSLNDPNFNESNYLTDSSSNILASCLFNYRPGDGGEYISNNFTQLAAMDVVLDTPNLDDISLGNNTLSLLYDNTENFAETIISSPNSVINILDSENNLLSESGVIYSTKGFLISDPDFISAEINYDSCEYHGLVWSSTQQENVQKFWCRTFGNQLVNIITNEDFVIDDLIESGEYIYALGREVPDYILTKLIKKDGELYAHYSKAPTRSNYFFNTIDQEYQSNLSLFSDVVIFKLPSEFQIAEINVNSFDHLTGVATVTQEITGTNMPNNPTNIYYKFNREDVSNYLNSVYSNMDGDLSNLLTYFNGDFAEYFSDGDAPISYTQNNNPFSASHNIKDTSYLPTLPPYVPSLSQYPSYATSQENWTPENGFNKFSERDLEAIVGKNTILGLDTVVAPTTFYLDDLDSDYNLTKTFELVYYLERNNENIDVFGENIGTPDYKVKKFGLNICDFDPLSPYFLENQTTAGSDLPVPINCNFRTIDDILINNDLFAEDHLFNFTIGDLNSSIEYIDLNLSVDLNMSNILEDLNLSYVDSNISELGYDLNTTIASFAKRTSYDYPSIAINNSKTKIAILGIKNDFINYIDLDENSSDYNKFSPIYRPLESSFFVLIYDILNDSWSYNSDIYNLTDRNTRPVTTKGNTLLFDSQDNLRYAFIARNSSEYNVDGVYLNMPDLTTNTIPSELVHSLKFDVTYVTSIVPQSGKNNSGDAYICDNKDLNSGGMGCMFIKSTESAIPNPEYSPIEGAGYTSGYSQQAINTDNDWLAQIWMDYPIVRKQDTSTAPAVTDGLIAGGDGSARYIRLSLSNNNGINWTAPIDLVAMSGGYTDNAVFVENYDPNHDNPASYGFAFPTLASEIVDLENGKGRLLLNYYIGDLSNSPTNYLGGQIKTVVFDFNFDSIVFDNNSTNYQIYLYKKNDGTIVDPYISDIELDQTRSLFVKTRANPLFEGPINYKYIYDDDFCSNLNTLVNTNDLKSCIKGTTLTYPVYSSIENSTMDIKYHFPTVIPRRFPGPVQMNAGCFKEGTKVLTVDGYLPIESIETGMYVYSYDLKNNNLIETRVNQLLVHEKGEEANNWVVISLENGLEITSTLNHSYYDPLNKKYKQLIEFKIGDQLLYFDEDNNESINVKIIGLRDLKETIDVYYNLDVGDPHNYIVDGIVVHNLDKEGYACTATGNWFGVRCATHGVGVGLSPDEIELYRQKRLRERAEFLHDFFKWVEEKNQQRLYDYDQLVEDILRELEQYYGLGLDFNVTINGGPQLSDIEAVANALAEDRDYFLNMCLDHYTYDDYVSDMELYGSPIGYYDYITDSWSPQNPYVIDPTTFFTMPEIIDNVALEIELQEFAQYSSLLKTENSKKVINQIENIAKDIVNNPYSFNRIKYVIDDFAYYNDEILGVNYTILTYDSSGQQILEVTSKILEINGIIYGYEISSIDEFGTENNFIQFVNGYNPATLYLQKDLTLQLNYLFPESDFPDFQFPLEVAREMYLLMNRLEDSFIEDVMRFDFKNHIFFATDPLTGNDHVSPFYYLYNSDHDSKQNMLHNVLFYLYIKNMNSKEFDFLINTLDADSFKYFQILNSSISEHFSESDLSSIDLHLRHVIRTRFESAIYRHILAEVDGDLDYSSENSLRLIDLLNDCLNDYGDGFGDSFNLIIGPTDMSVSEINEFLNIYEGSDISSVLLGPATYTDYYNSVFAANLPISIYLFKNGTNIETGKSEMFIFGEIEFIPVSVEEYKSLLLSTEYVHPDLGIGNPMHHHYPYPSISSLPSYDYSNTLFMQGYKDIIVKVDKYSSDIEHIRGYLNLLLAFRYAGQTYKDDMYRPFPLWNGSRIYLEYISESTLYYGAP